MLVRFGFPQVIWSAGDEDKYSGKPGQPNESIISAVVAEGVVSMSTEKMFDVGGSSFKTGVFQWCTKLKRAKLPKSLKSIGEMAFWNCEALLRVDIPSGVNEIGRNAFCRCLCLKAATIPEGIINLPDYLFFHCKALKSVKLPSSLKTIGEGAFSHCKTFRTINDDALEGVTEIGEYAFCACAKLTAFKLPPLLKTIKRFAFYQCKKMAKVVLPPSLETIEGNAFEGCDSTLTIDLPDSVRSVEYHAFKGCVVRLPPSLSVLTNGGAYQGLLTGVETAEISSRLSLEQLALLNKYIRNEMNSYAHRITGLNCIQMTQIKVRPVLSICALLSLSI